MSRYYLALAVLALSLAGCKREAQFTPFLPPTQAVPGTPAALQPLTSTENPLADQTVAPTEAPPCTDSLIYLEDLTIPDGSTVAPGALLDKRWQVRNSGTCNWDERYRIKLISGAAMGASPEQALYPARGGAELTIQIVFTAPAESGPYESSWQAFDPQGNSFGDPFFIQVVVEAPTPTP